MSKKINYLDNCRVILVNTTHPGNVGSAARAMKTMGLTELYLVSTNTEIIDDYAVARASGADDILLKATIVETLQEAIVDCHYLLGTSARERTLSSTVITPKEAAYKAINNYASKNYKIGILFGQERMGLTNEELSLCHQQILIATNPDFSSLNIASAVQLICYEFNLANIDLLNLIQKPAATVTEIKTNNLSNLSNLASVNEMELFYQHLERVMLKTEFMDPKQPKLLMRRLRRLFNRAEVSQQELNILRGIFTACEKHIFKNNI